jgi:hypothetical protein
MLSPMSPPHSQEPPLYQPARPTVPTLVTLLIPQKMATAKVALLHSSPRLRPRPLHPQVRHLDLFSQTLLAQVLSTMPAHFLRLCARPRILVYHQAGLLCITRAQAQACASVWICRAGVWTLTPLASVSISTPMAASMRGYTRQTPALWSHYQNVTPPRPLRLSCSPRLHHTLPSLPQVQTS